MSIQRFIKEELPKLNLNLNNVVAICNAVPDEEARKMVAKTFPRHFIAYPGTPSKVAINTASNIPDNNIENKLNYKIEEYEEDDIFLDI